MCGRAIHGVEFSWENQELIKGSRRVALSRQQTDLIQILWNKHPAPVRPDQLISRLYGSGEEPDTAAAIVKVQFGAIRRKLADAKMGVGITCRRGVGYALDFSDNRHIELTDDIALFFTSQLQAMASVKTYDDLMAAAGMGFEKLGFVRLCYHSAQAQGECVCGCKDGKVTAQGPHVDESYEDQGRRFTVPVLHDDIVRAWFHLLASPDEDEIRRAVRNLPMATIMAHHVFTTTLLI